MTYVQNQLVALTNQLKELFKVPSRATSVVLFVALFIEVDVAMFVALPVEANSSLVENGFGRAAEVPTILILSSLGMNDKHRCKMGIGQSMSVMHLRRRKEVEGGRGNIA